MPFDIGFGELLVIGVVALIVIGPKDLPQMFRGVGRFTGRMRAMADDFRRTMESAADEAGVNDIKRDFKEVSNYAKNESGVSEANQAIREFNSTRLDEPDLDDVASLESEAEADLHEDEIRRADQAKKKAVAKAKSEPKPSKSKKTKPTSKKAKT